jgi:hypothetical protein
MHFCADEARLLLAAVAMAPLAVLYGLQTVRRLFAGRR